VTITSRTCPGCDAAEARRFGERNAHLILRCERCATLYTIDGIEHTYDAGYAGESEAPPFLARRFDDIVARFDSSRRNGRLLDIGFGAGDLLDAARRAGWTTAGVEVARAAVERARQSGTEAFHGTLQEARFEAASFDVVSAEEILEHVTDVRPLLVEIARVLRPGGLLWATTPHARGLSARVLGASWSVVNPPSHVQLFSIRGLRALLRRTGFGGVTIDAEGVNPHELLRRGHVTSRERLDSAYALNAFFEEDRGRRFVKRVVNRALSITRLGDSLKVFARRA